MEKREGRSLESLSVDELKNMPEYFLRWDILNRCVQGYVTNTSNPHLDFSYKRLFRLKEGILREYQIFKKAVPENIREVLKKDTFVGPCINAAAAMEEEFKRNNIPY